MYESNQLYIRVFDADHRSIDQRWNTRDVRSTYWRLYVNDRSGAALRLTDAGGTRWAIPARRTVLVPAWVGFSCENQRAIEHRYVHFDVIGLPAPVTRRWFEQPLTVEPAPSETKTAWDDLARRAAEAIDGATERADPATVLRVQAATGEAVARALTLRLNHEALHPRLTGTSDLRPALDYIERHLNGDLSVETLAELAHMSAGHFSRLFRERMGQPPARFVRDRRIARAAQMLVFTDRTIDAVAAAVGFNDRFHFTRVFARYMGVPPARYRRTDRV